MPSIQVYLQNGFQHDRVTVEAAGQVAEEADVTTRYQIGLAEVVELTVPDDAPTPVRVTVADRGLTGEATVDAVRTPYLLVDLTGGRLTIEPSSAPPMLA